MKNLFLSLLVLSCAQLFFTSCEKQALDGVTEMQTLQERGKPSNGLEALSSDCLAEGQSCIGTPVPIYAGQHTNVGYLYYSLNGDLLNICVVTTCTISESHLFVGDHADLPSKNPAPGKFAIKDEGCSSPTWSIDVSSLEDCFAIAYHGVGCNETLWANGGLDFAGANWATYLEACKEDEEVTEE